MSKKHIVKYKVSRQLKLALKALSDRILQKEYKVIESQDILFSLLDVQDTGIGYALGYYSLTKGKLLKEFANGKMIGSRPRTNIESEELEAFSKRRIIHNQITSSHSAK